MTMAKTKSQAALALRLAGAGFEEIAETLEMPNAAHARRIVEAGLAAEVTTEARDHHRHLANLRYNELLKALWDRATDPTHPEQLPAGRQAREIVDRMVVLNGAAQPAEVIVTNPTSDQILAWLAKVAPMSLPGVEEHDPFDIVEGEVVDDQGNPEV